MDWLGIGRYISTYRQFLTNDDVDLWWIHLYTLHLKWRSIWTCGGSIYNFQLIMGLSGHSAILSWGMYNSYNFFSWNIINKEHILQNFLRNRILISSGFPPNSKLKRTLEDYRCEEQRYQDRQPERGWERPEERGGEPRRGISKTKESQPNLRESQVGEGGGDGWGMSNLSNTHRRLPGATRVSILILAAHWNHWP